MIDWLVAWGVKNALGFAFEDVLKKLAEEGLELGKEGLEDYVKEFFKDSTGKIVRLTASKPLKIAFGQAEKEFLSILQQQFEDLELTDEEIAEYKNIISEFVCHKLVLNTLGKPVEQKLGLLSNREELNLEVLDSVWKSLSPKSYYKPLPDDFNWQEVSKKYLRKIDRLVAQSDELRELLNTENLRTIKETLEQQAPILPGFDLSSYQKNLTNAYRRLDLDTLAISGWENPMKLWDIFTPQKAINYSDLDSAEALRGQPEGLALRGQPEGLALRGQPEGLALRDRNLASISVLDLINETQTHKYIVVIGNPGAGKSTLTRYKVMQWTREEIVTLQTKELPILIELKNYLKNYREHKCSNFLEYLQHGSGIKGGNINQKELHEWLNNHESIVMFDGLDEVVDGATRENIVTDIINFKDNYPRTRIVITSRIIGYNKHKDQLENAKFKTFLLEYFDTIQVKYFVNKWHDYAFTNLTERELKRDRLQSAINNFLAFQELAGNPLLLTMMAILNRHEELPRDRATLYERASEILLHKWEAEKELPIDRKQDPEIRAYLKDKSTYKDKIEMLRLVAYRIQHDGIAIDNTLVIDEDDLEDILTDYLKTRIANKARIIARAFIKDITDRSFILCFLGDGKYGFIHKTFLEYFCAAHIVHLFEKKRTLTIDIIQQDYFIARHQDGTWHEILVLIVNILDETWAEGLLQCVIDKDGIDCEYQNIFLVVNCLRDIRNIRNVRSIIVQLSTKLEAIVANPANVSIDVRNRATEALKNIQSLS